MGSIDKPNVPDELLERARLVAAVSRRAAVGLIVAGLVVLIGSRATNLPVLSWTGGAVASRLLPLAGTRVGLLLNDAFLRGYHPSLGFTAYWLAVALACLWRDLRGPGRIARCLFEFHLSLGPGRWGDAHPDQPDRPTLTRGEAATMWEVRKAIASRSKSSRVATLIVLGVIGAVVLWEASRIRPITPVLDELRSMLDGQPSLPKALDAVRGAYRMGMLATVVDAVRTILVLVLIGAGINVWIHGARSRLLLKLHAEAGKLPGPHGCS
jgi:hypothetical protein